MKNLISLILLFVLAGCVHSGPRFKWQHEEYSAVQFHRDLAQCRNVGMGGQMVGAGVYNNAYRFEMMKANCMISKGYHKLWARKSDADYFGGACCLAKIEGTKGER